MESVINSFVVRNAVLVSGSERCRQQNMLLAQPAGGGWRINSQQRLRNRAFAGLGRWDPQPGVHMSPPNNESSQENWSPKHPGGEPTLISSAEEATQPDQEGDQKVPVPEFLDNTGFHGGKN